MKLAFSFLFLYYLIFFSVSTRRESAYMRQLFVRLELVMTEQLTKYEKKLIKLFILMEQNFKIMKLKFKHVSAICF